MHTSGCLSYWPLPIHHTYIPYICQPAPPQKKNLCSSDHFNMISPTCPANDYPRSWAQACLSLSYHSGKSSDANKGKRQLGNQALSLYRKYQHMYMLLAWSKEMTNICRSQSHNLQAWGWGSNIQYAKCITKTNHARFIVINPSQCHFFRPENSHSEFFFPHLKAKYF